METATQTLHRLTSYDPGRDWDEPVDDPLVLQDLEVNDLAHFPWFYKRYERSLPRVPLPRRQPPTIDSEVPALLGERLDALLFTCVGVPGYTSAAGGLPGVPTSVRKVAER